jgi:hypothetical protein
MKPNSRAQDIQLLFRLPREKSKKIMTLITRQKNNCVKIKLY